jgi:hypothetical protein
MGAMGIATVNLLQWAWAENEYSVDMAKANNNARVESSDLKINLFELGYQCCT